MPIYALPSNIVCIYRVTVFLLCPNLGKDTVDGEILQQVFYSIFSPKIKGFTAMHRKLHRVE